VGPQLDGRALDLDRLAAVALAEPDAVSIDPFFGQREDHKPAVTPAGEGWRMIHMIPNL
jgi:hypothetical protein